MTKLRIKYLFGATGILALLGFIGLFSDDKSFLAFFAFALNLEFFFIKDDELWDQMMMQSASRAFCLGMITMALTSLIFFLTRHSGFEALIGGLAAGWAAAVAFHDISFLVLSLKGAGSDD